MSELDSHIDSATQALLAQQHADGHFLFELEADATIPAEYVLLRHILANRSMRRSKVALPPICAAFKARMAAGRCFVTALST